MRGESLAVKVWRKILFRQQWFLEIEWPVGDSAVPDFSRTFPVYPPDDVFWADPFPVYRDGRLFIFVEELPFSTNKGHIAVVEVDAQGRVLERKTVLERPHHLSYPFILEWDGEIFMLPETGQNRTVELWRCERFPDQWVPHKVLLQDLFAVDATLLQWGGRWWMFVNVAAPGQSIHEHLHLYFSDSPFGPFRPHPGNPVKSVFRGARPAGRIFEFNGALIRPSQNCDRVYGEEIILHRIARLSEKEYGEEEMEVIRPGWRKGVRCVHTINTSGPARVLDALRWLSRWK